MLPKTGFLSDASPELLDLLEELSKEVRLKPKETLFEKDDPGDAVFAVISGSLETSVLSSDGRRLVLDVMKPGALFGEIALFDPGPRTATIIAIEPTTLRRLKNSDVVAAISESPRLAQDMIKLAGQRMRSMSNQIGDQVFLALSTRLARKILHLTQDGDDVLEHLTMSQAYLADFVGATREAVSKTLSEWSKLGIVSRSRRDIQIHDREALEDLAAADLF
ncbi:MAG: Crp/Fnr family transcriptional regulator [Pseudomonadota bacterium]